jgi:transcriptional regulator with XRE-family HTH domain
MNLGLHIKKIRLDRGLTLADVAKQIGVTSGLLSQIENEITTPSISSLIEILRVFKMPLSVFFQQLEKDDVIVSRSYEEETIKGVRGVIVTLLASKLSNNVLESYTIKLTTNEVLQLKTIQSEINGERFLLVKKGSIEIKLSKEKHVLSQGDSINFKSHLECSITRKGRAIAEIFLNGTPPIM